MDLRQFSASPHVFKCSFRPEWTLQLLICRIFSPVSFWHACKLLLLRVLGLRLWLIASWFPLASKPVLVIIRRRFTLNLGTGCCLLLNYRFRLDSVGLHTLVLNGGNPGWFGCREDLFFAFRFSWRLSFLIDTRWKRCNITVCFAFSWRLCYTYLFFELLR